MNTGRYSCCARSQGFVCLDNDQLRRALQAYSTYIKKPDYQRTAQTSTQLSHSPKPVHFRSQLVLATAGATACVTVGQQAAVTPLRSASAFKQAWSTSRSGICCLQSYASLPCPAPLELVTCASSDVRCFGPRPVVWLRIDKPHCHMRLPARRDLM